MAEKYKAIFKTLSNGIRDQKQAEEYNCNYSYLHDKKEILFTENNSTFVLKKNSKLKLSAPTDASMFASYKESKDSLGVRAINNSDIIILSSDPEILKVTSSSKSYNNGVFTKINHSLEPKKVGKFYLYFYYQNPKSIMSVCELEVVKATPPPVNFHGASYMDLFYTKKQALLKNKKSTFNCGNKDMSKVVLKEKIKDSGLFGLIQKKIPVDPDQDDYFSEDSSSIKVGDTFYLNVFHSKNTGVFLVEPDSFMSNKSEPVIVSSNHKILESASGMHYYGNKLKAVKAGTAYVGLFFYHKISSNIICKVTVNL